MIKINPKNYDLCQILKFVPRSLKTFKVLPIAAIPWNMHRNKTHFFDQNFGTPPFSHHGLLLLGGKDAGTSTAHSCTPENELYNCFKS